MVTLYIGVIEIKIIRYPHIKARTMKLITKETDKSLGSFREDLSHVVSYINLCCLQFPPAFKKGEQSQTMPSTGYS